MKPSEQIDTILQLYYELRPIIVNHEGSKGPEELDLVTYKVLKEILKVKE